MNSNRQGQGATLEKIVESFSKSKTSSDLRKEELESRKEVENREEKSRKKEGIETMPVREERKAEEYRKRQRREREDYSRGYHQWQPRRSPRKNK